MGVYIPISFILRIKKFRVSTIFVEDKKTMKDGGSIIKKVTYWLDYVGRVISWVARVIRDFPLPEKQEPGETGTGSGS
jgi:hypothetical protein